MPTLNERFEAYMTSPDVLKNGSDPLEGFLAGADAQKQIVVEILNSLKQTDEEAALSIDGYNEALAEALRQVGENNG